MSTPDHRDGHATLAAGPIGRAHEGIDGVVEVRIGHDHRMILGAAERLHALTVCAPGGVDVLGDRRRADEADRLHARIGQQRIDGFFVAVDHVQHARRQAGL